MPETAVKLKSSRKSVAPVPKPSSNSPEPPPDAGSAPGTLTFVTSEGERIVFSDMDLPLGEVAPLASEETLGRIWNRPAEDAAWRDI